MSLTCNSVLPQRTSIVLPSGAYVMMGKAFKSGLCTYCVAGSTSLNDF